MKQKLIAASMLVLLLALAAAPGQMRSTVELFWDPLPTNAGPSAVVKVYTTANVAATNWVLMVTLPASTTNLFLSPMQAGAFYAVTASNVWGESPFSAAVWVPTQPSSNGAVSIR